MHRHPMQHIRVRGSVQLSYPIVSANCTSWREHAGLYMLIMYLLRLIELFRGIKRMF